MLQIFNLFLGVLIYIPFIKMSEDRHIKIFKENINKLSDIVKECEAVGASTNLLGEPGKLGAISRMLLEDMKYAIDNEEIDMFYQPQVNYDGEILGAEALLKGNHSIGGYLYPPLLVSLDEEGELLNKLGGYTIDKTCKGLKEIEKIFEDNMKISVNISPDQLKGSYNLPSCIKQIIDKYNVNPKMIGIEITEQVALSGAKIIEERMEEIRNLGVKLIMDDFGMGHSSLINLKSNNFDMVKLDGSLVKEILINDRSSNIIESIVYLSNSLYFNIMVEYVETIEQREKLKELGCENYQGYLYSKAIPFNDFVRYIRENEKSTLT